MSPLAPDGIGINPAARTWVAPLSRQSFRKGVLITVTFASVLLQPGCSKWTHFVESRRASRRVAQIDAQLAHWTPTGRVGDADARAALRAERARLVRQFGLEGPVSNVTVQTLAVPTPASTPVPTVGPSKIVVAPASMNTIEETDPEKLRQLNITSGGGHFDPRTNRIEPNATPWTQADKP